MPFQTSPLQKRRALLSVSDKDGIVDFAKKLQGCGFEILSTGGTQKILEDAGVLVTHLSSVTQFPECFSGRVKTMHLLIMGGILYKREDEAHRTQAQDLGISPIDLVVVNLYPFRATLQKLGFHAGEDSFLPDTAIEQIDIGGPTLLRSAAKNYASVTVVCDANDFDRIAEEIQKNGDTSLVLRQELAGKAFLHTAAYDALIAETMSNGKVDGVTLVSGRTLRYGENPHQWGKFYEIEGTPEQKWHQIHGKELSYLNLLDGDSAWRMVSEFPDPAVVMVKHANPSGIATSDTIEDAFQKAYDTDRLSAFGVIIALNRSCSKGVAEKIIDQKIFVEVILAPEFDPEALKILRVKPNIRLLSMNGTRFSENIVYRSAFGGMLAQNDDVRDIREADCTCVTKLKPTKGQMRDLLFAWKVVKHAKSNAIVLAKNTTTVGIGCGQTSRVDSTWIALKRADEHAQDSVLASDAFFPFADSIEEAAKHGIAAVIQPGGSVKDAEVIAKADEIGLVMLFTGVRAFRH